MAVPPEEIVERLNRMRDRSGVVITVDVFDRLLASGRVGRGRALLGSMLRLKPILGVDRAGKLVPLGKAFGRRRATRALLDAVARQIPDGARVRFGIVWVGNDDIVAPVRETLQARYGRDVEILTAPATPVIATHTGPGAWGLAWLVED
jgi:DegV family protein with EDD domain